MNIFILDSDPKLAAQAHNNKHVVKMVLESTQILSTVINVHGGSGPYKTTHVNHPCVKWAGETVENFVWLKRLLYELLYEYTHRYDKVHKCAQVYRSLLPPASLSRAPRTPHVICMPEDCKVTGEPVESYRAYYMKHKRDFAEWKNRNVPEWWK